MSGEEKDLVAREARHGEKMIEVKLRFWTDQHAWSSGMVRVEGNKSHGITPTKPLPFHSLLDMGAVIEKVLLEHKIVLHPSRKMKKYVKEK